MCHIRPEDYDSALHAQSACNLSGIVFSFAEIMKRICDEAHALGQGTEWRNKHPIARLFAEQIAHLTGDASIAADGQGYDKAYKECLERGTDKMRQRVKEGAA
jgi:hypothetical protein